jgi:hypothetical protein
MVALTIGLEFFQFVAIAPAFYSLEIVIRIVANLFLLDVIKMAGADKSGFWSLLIALCAVVFLWFFIVISIMLNIDKCLKRSNTISRMYSFFSGVYLPFFGNTMFLPFAALLVDTFVCDHEA